MVRTLATAVLFAVLTLPFPAVALDKNNYMAVKGGLFTFTDSLKDANFQTGFDGEIVFGRYLSRNIAAEIGTGYFHDGVNKGYGNEVKGIPVTLSLKAVPPLSGAEVYAGAGLDVYRAKFHGMVGDRFADKWNTLYGAHVLAGGQVDVSRSVFIGLEGRYLFTNKGDFTVLRSSLDGFIYTVNIGYRF